MSWVDNLLSSSLIVWLIIGFGLLHLYMRRTGKTLPEVIREFVDAVNALFEEETPVKKP